MWIWCIAGGLLARYSGCLSEHDLLVYFNGEELNEVLLCRETSKNVWFQTCCVLYIIEIAGLYVPSE